VFSARLAPELIGGRSVRFNMKHRGVEYSVVQGGQPDVWRWSVMVGQPAMLRLGEATTEQQAEMQVWRVIDRSLDVAEALRFSDPAKR
jgi:hypothetical protein